MGRRILQASDLLTLESYARERAAFRARVMEHKKLRQIHVGPDMTWCFEDRLTVQYQVQEMLRIERIFEQPAIEEELAAYNPLIPDGTNLKATLLIEIPDPELRRQRLALLKGVEDACYLQVAGSDRVMAVADEDMERENDAKTSSVHFLRFEFTAPMAGALKAGAALSAGVDHAAYRHRIESLPQETLRCLVADLE
jgi:Protein of unknown function (DUF3501)